MFKFLYSLGLRKQEIYLIIFFLVVFLSGLTIKFFYSKPLPHFNIDDKNKELNVTLDKSFKRLDSVRSERYKHLVNLSDSLEDVYDTSNPYNLYNSENKLNLNTAMAGDLEKLPGIGRVMAERIMAYREEHLFKNTVELMNIKGIGQKKFEKIKDIITVK